MSDNPIEGQPSSSSGGLNDIYKMCFSLAKFGISVEDLDFEEAVYYIRLYNQEQQREEQKRRSKCQTT